MKKLVMIMVPLLALAAETALNAHDGEQLPAEAGYIPALTGSRTSANKAEDYSIISLEWVTDSQKYFTGAVKFDLRDLDLEYSSNGGMLDAYALKLAFERGTFDRATQSYRVKPLIQLNRFNLRPNSSGFTVWRELELETLTRHRYDIGDGKSLDLQVVRDSGGRAVSIKLYGVKNNTVWGEKTIAYEELRKNWEFSASVYPMYDSNGRRWYALPQTFWIGGDKFRHGFVLGDEASMLSPRTGLPLDFVELCRGNWKTCDSLPTAISAATGLKFTPFGPSWVGSWKVEYMSLAELQAAIDAELGPER